jgi:hypothetical protein
LNKYRNIKTNIDGIKFDSKREAERYAELKLMEKAKLISNLELQPKFILQEGFKYQGKKEQAITYIADFKYKEASGVVVVEDVKGVATDPFKIKRKMFLYHHGQYYDYRIVR